MAMALAAGLQDSLSCSICVLPFSNHGDRLPSVMPCFHTFCAGCIRKLAAPVACPTCRKPCHKPVSDLLPNFALVDVIDAARASAKGGAVCMLCEGETHAAVLRCTDPTCANEVSGPRGKMATMHRVALMS